jgi:hypothetical protein
MVNKMAKLGTATALIGFYCKNKYYVSYQAEQSEPCFLGKNIVSELKSIIQPLSGQEDLGDDYARWKEKFLDLRIVSDHQIPNLEDITNLKKYTDLNVSRCSETDWYCLTYLTKGSLKSILDSGYIYNYVDESGLPFFQDYAYILNFDSDMLDFYEDYRVIKSYYLSDLPDW